jgi:hypothetical protein
LLQFCCWNSNGISQAQLTTAIANGSIPPSTPQLAGEVERFARARLTRSKGSPLSAQAYASPSSQ